ncbi:MAG: hypothetical protein GYA51_02720 [Candidatus Methanofastidiosa archaeon]|nr:hypothetical protein [Candidatus Methanofastidiosa archaeon]
MAPIHIFMMCFVKGIRILMIMFLIKHFITDKPPYGYEDAFGGIYVAIACLDKGVEADVVLMGDGVCAALKKPVFRKNN